MFLSQNPGGCKGSRGVRRAQKGAGGAVRMTGLGLVGEKDRDLKVNATNIIGQYDTQYLERTNLFIVFFTQSLLSVVKAGTFRNGGPHGQSFRC